MFIRVMLVAVALAVSSKDVVAETTQGRLARFGDDLAAAWKTYPSDKDETVRRQKFTDLNSAVIGEIAKLDPPEKLTIQRAIDNYSSNVQRAKTLFRLEKMNSEKGQYITACGAAFRRELNGKWMTSDRKGEPFISDIATPRTASKCFDMLVEWCDASRVVLRTAPEEAHSPYYTALNEAFGLMMKTSTKDAGDPTEVYDGQLKLVRRRFPLTSEVLENTNKPIVTVLEGASKLANTRNKKPG